MILTRRGFAAGSGMAAALAAGRRASAQDAGTLRMALAARGLRTLDPHNSIQGADDWSITHIHDTLAASPPGRFAQTPDQFQPRLATGWTLSPDARTWTFRLREGVTWQKGYGPFTADDVVFTLNRARDPRQGSSNRGLWDTIATVEADGPHTVVIRTRTPDPLLISRALQSPAGSIMCRRATEERGEAIARDPVGTGPYQFVSLDPDPSKGVLMAANPDHFDGPPKTPNLQVLYVLDTTARTLALLSGNVHMIEGVRAPGWPASIRQKNPRLLFDVAAPGSLFTMHFNLTRKPLDDLRVRQAFAYAIDRDSIARALAPIGRRTYGLNPPGYPGGFTRDTAPAEFRYDFDPDHARHLLADAGFANGVALDAYTSQREDYASSMLIVQELMRKVGVKINLQLIDHTTFHANNRRDMNALPQNSSAYPPAPSLPLQENLARTAEVKADGSGGINYSHYGVAIPGIDDLLAQADAEPDFAKRVAVIDAAERKVLHDLPLIPLGTNGYLIVRDPRVSLGYEVQSGYALWPLAKATIS